MRMRLEEVQGRQADRQCAREPEFKPFYAPSQTVAASTRCNSRLLLQMPPIGPTNGSPCWMAELLCEGALRASAQESLDVCLLPGPVCNALKEREVKGRCGCGRGGLTGELPHIKLESWWECKEAGKDGSG